MPLLDRKTIRDVNRAIRDGLRYRRRRARRAPCIAVVDPDHFRRGTIVGTLQRAGFVTLNAVDAHEASRLLAVESIDLVAMAVEPSDGPSLDALAQVRRRRPEIPVLVLFPDGSDPARAEPIARGIGASSTLIRPVGSRVLLRSVKKLLEH